jgi:hypothetical protein
VFYISRTTRSAEFEVDETGSTNARSPTSVGVRHEIGRAAPTALIMRTSPPPFTWKPASVSIEAIMTEGAVLDGLSGLAET